MEPTLFPPWLLGYRRQWFYPGEYIPPFSIDDLLRELGLVGAPRDEQDAAITTWLETHEPSYGLVVSLYDFGYYRRLTGSRRKARTMMQEQTRAAFERAVAAGLVD